MWEVEQSRTATNYQTEEQLQMSRTTERSGRVTTFVLVL